MSLCTVMNPYSVSMPHIWSIQIYSFHIEGKPKPNHPTFLDHWIQELKAPTLNMSRSVLVIHIELIWYAFIFLHQHQLLTDICCGFCQTSEPQILQIRSWETLQMYANLQDQGLEVRTEKSILASLFTNVTD